MCYRYNLICIIDNAWGVLGVWEYNWSSIKVVSSTSAGSSWPKMEDVEAGKLAHMPCGMSRSSISFSTLAIRKLKKRSARGVPLLGATDYEPIV